MTKKTLNKLTMGISKKIVDIKIILLYNFIWVSLCRVDLFWKRQKHQRSYNKLHCKGESHFKNFIKDGHCITSLMVDFLLSLFTEKIGRVAIVRCIGEIPKPNSCLAEFWASIKFGWSWQTLAYLKM